MSLICFFFSFALVFSFGVENTFVHDLPLDLQFLFEYILKSFFQYPLLYMVSPSKNFIQGKISMTLSKLKINKTLI